MRRNDNETVLTAKANVQTITATLHSIAKAGEVFQQFDGKVINKRIIEALRETGASYEIPTESYKPALEVKQYSSRSVSGNPDKNGCCIAYYATRDSWSSYNHKREANAEIRTEDNRVDAAAAIVHLAAIKEQLEAQLKEEKYVVRYFDSLKAKAQKINEKAKKARDEYSKLPFTFRNFNQLRDF